MKGKYPELSPELQLEFHFKLKRIKDFYFHEALRNTIKKLRIEDIDSELRRFVPDDSLSKLALSSLRGEVIFPIPLILRANPFLVGYYRLVYGFSQKEFYSKGPFGSFKSMEESGTISKIAGTNLDDFCLSLISAAKVMVDEIDNLSIEVITELQLLTVGPQFRGSKNNTYGRAAAERTLTILKEMVGHYIDIESSTPDSIKIKNDSGRLVDIAFAADPDIEIREMLSSGKERGLISIEIKGGRDISNIHNRIGEAEKSHQKAKGKGYSEFMTIISVDIDYATLRKESPTTTHFFHIDKIGEKGTQEYTEFTALLSSIIGIQLD